MKGKVHGIALLTQLIGASSSWTFHFPNHHPSHCAFCLCTCWMCYFFSKLEINFPNCAVSFLSCFPSPWSHFIIYSFPLTDGPPSSSLLCLWFLNHASICSDAFVFSPASRSYSFFLLNNSCLPTLILDASEIDSVDGTRIPAIYFLLQLLILGIRLSSSG